MLLISLPLWIMMCIKRSERVLEKTEPLALIPEAGYCLGDTISDDPMGLNPSSKNLFKCSSIFKVEPGVVAHSCNPSTWEAETGGSGFVASLS